MPLNPLGKDIPTTLGDLPNEVNRVFDRFWHCGLSTRPLDGQAWAPPVDVFEEADRVVLVAEVPGMEANDVEVIFQEERLTLKGHRESPWGEETGKKLLRRERRYGAFSRTIDLPPGIDPDGITATVRNGVITVTLLKVEQARGKAIKVSAGE